jgi:urease gamma subunit
VVVRPISREEVSRFDDELDAHHWLGHRLTGQVMRYAAVLDDQWVAVVGFGSAVLSCAARDRFVGWSREQQYARLRHIANNQRFCVLPAGRQPNLASAVLSRVLRRVSGDYLAVYGHRVVAVETFTDPARHTGACYAAANFRLLGDSLGFGRSAGRYHHHGRPKRVWMYLLRPDAAAVLSSVFDHPLLMRKTGGIDLNTVPLAGASGLLGVLAQLSDPRKRRGVRHRVAAVLTMVAAATLAGCRSFRSVADFIADLPPDALARLGARQHPVTGRYLPPSEATVRRTVKQVNADEADALVGAWLMDQVRAERTCSGKAPAFTALACDGKTLKGAWPELNTPTSKVRLFSALVHGEGVVVGQRNIPEHTTEVTQVIPLLDAVASHHHSHNVKPDLTGLVLTADALHVHRANLQEVVERGGEYVLTVKRNQPTLHAAIKNLFADADGSFPPSPHHL